jgi:hypothetical protein
MGSALSQPPTTKPRGSGTENSKLLATLQWIPSANLGAIHDRLAVVARDSTAGDTPRDTPYLRVLRHFVHE